MRFISHIRNYGVGILPRRTEILPGGVEREIQPQFIALFKQGDFTAEELEFSERHWKKLPGQTFEQDEVTPTSRLGRISVFDTDEPETASRMQEIDRQMMVALNGEPAYLPDGSKRWYDGATLDWTLAKLTDKASRSDTFAVVEEFRLSPPWPLYDGFPGTAEDLVEVVVIQGHSLPATIAYERQNQKRPEVITLLEEKLSELAEEQGISVEDYVSA